LRDSLASFLTVTLAANPGEFKAEVIAAKLRETRASNLSEDTKLKKLKP